LEDLAVKNPYDLLNKMNTKEYMWKNEIISKVKEDQEINQ
jgi:hypothetical protein